MKGVSTAGTRLTETCLSFFPVLNEAKQLPEIAASSVMIRLDDLITVTRYSPRRRGQY
jgi:hypothetical protein